MLGRIATGPRAGQCVLRLGTDPAAPLVSTAGPRHAQAAGFDLHANVAVRAGDRRRLEHLCRYVLRPPLAQDALEQTPAGAVLLRLRRPWRDGTRAIRFAPTELLEKLAAMIPRPRANLLFYHGAFAPRAPPLRDIRPRHVAWAELLRRTFAIDVLACPHCGGRLRLLATIAAPAVLATILAHLKLPMAPPDPAPARVPDWLPGLGADLNDAAGPSSE